MSVTNGKISPRLGTKLATDNSGDLQQVFNSTNKTHSWYFLGDDGKASHINIWAKYKPFRHPNGAIYSGHFTNENGVALPSSDRSVGARNANYGLIPPTLSGSTITDVYGKLWSYAPCQSNIDPMQAQDFENYNDNVLPPIQPMSITPDPVEGSIINYYRAMTTAGIDFSSIETGPRDDAIGIKDIADLDGWYVCVALCRNRNFTDGNYKWKTASSPIQLNTTAHPETVPCPVLTHSNITSLGGYIYYYICLADTKYDDWSQNTPVTGFKPIPTDSVLNIKGMINIIGTVVTNLTIMKAAFVNNPSSSNFVDITSYTGAGDTYYQVPGYYFSLQVKAKAPAGNSVTLQKSSLRIALSQTFNGGRPSNIQIATLRNSSFTSVSSITIAAGAEVTFYIICSAQLLAIDGTGNEAAVTETGKQLHVTVTLSHNGVNFSNDQSIRLSN